MVTSVDNRTEEANATRSAVTHLECSRTGATFNAGEVHNTSPDGWPLLVRYDLERLRRNGIATRWPMRRRSMWRYAPLLPVRRPRTSSRWARAGRRCIV